MSERITTQTWARAREAYLAGETAGAVCARFGIGRSAFFAAAQEGGWRRSDAVRLATPDGEPPSPPADALPCVDLAEAAMARASAAVMGGRLHEAQGWTRLAADLRRMALDEIGAANWREAQGAAMDAEAHGRHMADRLTTAPPSWSAPIAGRAHGPPPADRDLIPYGFLMRITAMASGFLIDLSPDRSSCTPKRPPDAFPGR